MTKEDEAKEFFPVYYVKAANDRSVLLAINLLIDQGNYAVWFDGNRERMFKFGRLARVEDGTIEIERIDAAKDEDRLYQLIPLNLAIYNEFVKPRLVNPSEFSSDEELLRAFTPPPKTKNND